MSRNRELEQRIGIAFQDPGLLKHALTHSSWSNERRQGHLGSNERLEFLGDAVLELVSSDFFFHHFPAMTEGNLSRIRAAFVCEQALALCAEQISLGTYLLLGRGEDQTGGRERPSVVSDAMEALIGAIYLDQGLEAARSFIHRFILNDVDRKQYFYDAKTILQEEIQKQENQTLSYLLKSETGPEHQKEFTAAAVINGQEFAFGKGRNKKQAEQMAAFEALKKLGVTEQLTNS